jgi:hypothetical protein
MVREFSEAEVLNRLERKAKKGKATRRELRLLAEGYGAFGIPIPRNILKQI